MTVKAEKALLFECEKCGYVQFVDYGLCDFKYKDVSTNEDYINCANCFHKNHVIEQLDFDFY